MAHESTTGKRKQQQRMQAFKESEQPFCLQNKYFKAVRRQYTREFCRSIKRIRLNLSMSK